MPTGHTAGSTFLTKLGRIPPSKLALLAGFIIVEPRVFVLDKSARTKASYELGSLFAAA